MVKPVQKAQISSFIKGLISEASPLNFPPDASRDEENFELNKDGTRQRRLGMDLEPDYATLDTGFLNASINDIASSSYKWVGANGDPNNEFSVVQFGNRLDFFDLALAANVSGGFIGSKTLTGAPLDVVASFSSVEGYLIITVGTDLIHQVEWDGDSLSYSNARLLVRDLWGIPDGYDLNDSSTRPSNLIDEHTYNLRNQGWGIKRRVITVDGSLNATRNALVDPIDEFFTQLNQYPSNEDLVHQGMDYQPVVGQKPNEVFMPTLLSDKTGLGTPAAKGFFIIDALRRGSSRLTEYQDNQIEQSLSYPIVNLKDDTTLKGASVSADFAGRIFYAGFSGEIVEPEESSPRLSSYVLFTQVVRGKSDLVKCYQQGDPTSRDGYEILDTDGGYMRVSGAKKIIGLEVMSNSLFVIADNGVWVVTGGSDYGFTAANYKIDKLSTFGCFSQQSIVALNDKIIFWGEDGIFVIAKNQYGDWVVENISRSTIQKFYDGIPTEIRRAAVGAYDSFEKKIKWLYHDSDGSTKELVFDTVINSFSKVRIYNLAANTPKVLGYISTPSFNRTIEERDVVVGLDTVQANLEDVIVNVEQRLSKLQSLKYYTLKGLVGDNAGYAFCFYRNEDFLDWETVDTIGVDAKAFLLTGNITAGDTAVYKQAPYLVMHFYKTENGVVLSNDEFIPAKQSSCLFRVQWDWATTIVSGVWSQLYQAYKYRKPLFIVDVNDAYDNGFEVVTSKNKLRGRGRALSLYMETEPLKDCRILGWNLSLTGNNLA